MHQIYLHFPLILVLFFLIRSKCFVCQFYAIRYVFQPHRAAHMMHKHMFAGSNKRQFDSHAMRALVSIFYALRHLCAYFQISIMCAVTNAQCICAIIGSQLLSI